VAHLIVSLVGVLLSVVDLLGSWSSDALNIHTEARRSVFLRARLLRDGLHTEGERFLTLLRALATVLQELLLMGLFPLLLGLLLLVAHAPLVLNFRMRV